MTDYNGLAYLGTYQNKYYPISILIGANDWYQTRICSMNDNGTLQFAVKFTLADNTTVSNTQLSFKALWIKLD